jgi:hypothetical protein
MTCQLITPHLNDDQKDQICAILAYGCDRETAAGIVECTVVDIGNEITDDPRFAIKVRRAEATAELRHMQNILNATKDGKYWRASVWWLERRSPERFGRRSADAITPKQLEQALAAWNEVITREFPTNEEQKRVTACIEKLYASIELQLDASCSEALLKRFPPPRVGQPATATDVENPATSQDDPSTENSFAK